MILPNSGAAKKNGGCLRHDIFRESYAGIRFLCNIIPYFCRKLGKMSQNLSSAAVLIGALRVK